MVEDSPLTDDNLRIVEDTPPLTVKSPRMVEDSPLTDDSPRIVEGTPPLTVKSPLIEEDSPPLTDDNPLVEGTPPLTVKSPLIVEDSPPLTDDNSLVEDSPPLTVKSPLIEEDAPPPTDDRAGNGETLEEGIYFLTPSELMPPESDETVEEDALAVDDVLIEEGAPDVGEALPGNDEALAAEEAAPAAPEDGEVVENSRSDGSDGWIRKLELTPVHPGAGELYVQIGSYRNTAVLRDTIGKLKKDTPKYPLSYEVEVRDDGAVYRLLIGPLYPAEKVAVLRTVRSKLSPDAFHYSP